MATPTQVKAYLSCWFQLGKKIAFANGVMVLPEPIINGDRYSHAFESCWQQIVAKPETAYLEGTQQTVADLLSENWEINPCARCTMPVPIHSLGMPAELCPCHDVAIWPNTDLPKPRSPVDSVSRLNDIQKRLTDPTGVDNLLTYNPKL